MLPSDLIRSYCLISLAELVCLAQLELASGDRQVIDSLEAELVASGALRLPGKASLYGEVVRVQQSFADAGRPLLCNLILLTHQ